MPLIGIMGAGDEKWIPREKMNSLWDIFKRYSCTDVWQTMEMLVWNSGKML